VLVLVGVVGLLGLSHVMTGTLRDAIETRKQLEERHGDQASYVPPPDGAVAPDRLERFLRVREAVFVTCAEFEETSHQLRRMDELSPEAPRGEVFGEMRQLTGEVFRMVPRLGRFFELRNGALAAVDMGLGEYTYIYLVAYHDELRTSATSDGAFGDAEIGPRVHQALRQMLRHQLEALPSDAPWRPELAAEIERLERAPRRLPWRDGLPEAVAASVAPYRDRLDELYCAATMGLEFNTNRTRGLSVISE
jgi:hypothetical protein